MSSRNIEDISSLDALANFVKQKIVGSSDVSNVVILEKEHDIAGYHERFKLPNKAPVKTVLIILQRNLLSRNSRYISRFVKNFKKTTGLEFKIAENEVIYFGSEEDRVSVPMYAFARSYGFLFVWISSDISKMDKIIHCKKTPSLRAPRNTVKDLTFREHDVIGHC